MRLPVEQNALVSLLLTLVLAVALIWMVAGTMGRITDNAEHIRNASEIVDVVAELKEQLVDVETGERGYIITGVEAYLEPHEHSLAVVNKLRDKLISLLSADPLEQEYIAELGKRIDSKVAVSRANVRARKQGFELARARVMEGSGKREMDMLRVILNSIATKRIGARNELRNQRSEILEDLQRNMVVMVVVFVAVLAYLYWRLMKMVKLQGEADRRMQHLASYDTLTGLLNRRLILELLSQSIQRCMRHKSGMALLFLDLNGFKPVNDRHGHEAGDEVLIEVGRRLSSLVRASDRVARLGGDEFVILVEDVAGERDVEILIRKINDEIERPIMLSNGVEANISTSIGVAIYPRDGGDMETLLRNADTAMYEAKRTRR